MNLIATEARRLWPRKTAAEMAVRTGVSVRTAENWLSHVHDMPVDRLLGLIDSQGGDAFLDVMARSASKDAWQRFRARLADEIRREIAASLTKI